MARWPHDFLLRYPVLQELERRLRRFAQGAGDVRAAARRVAAQGDWRASLGAEEERAAAFYLRLVERGELRFSLPPPRKLARWTMRGGRLWRDRVYFLPEELLGEESTALHLTEAYLDLRSDAPVVQSPSPEVARRVLAALRARLGAA
jgi:hypothetical protein